MRLPVEAINANVNVNYGEDNGVAFFTGQIIIKGKRGVAFSAGGDSGSLIVTNDGNNPVALLFAGSTQTTVGSPIGEVLAAFTTPAGVTMAIDSDTAPPPPVATGSISGTVTDDVTNTGIDGATVSISGQLTTTDSNGSYTLKDVPVGERVVTLVPAQKNMEDLVCPKASLAAVLLTIHHGITEPPHMPRRLPDLGVHDDRAVDADHLIGCAVGTGWRVLHHVVPPAVFDVALQFGAEGAVVPKPADAAVNFAAAENEAPPPAQGDDLFHLLR